MPDPLVYLQAMGAAAIVSAMIVLAMAVGRPAAGATRRNPACILAMGFGLAVGCHLLSLHWAWPPANGLDRFLTLVVPAVLVSELITGFSSVPRWVAWLLRISLAAAVPRILLHGSVYLGAESNAWSPWQAIMVLAGCGGLLAAVWGLLSWLYQRRPGASIPFALALSAQCAGLTVMMAGYLKGGAAAFPLAASLAATTIAAWLMRSRAGAPANVSAAAMVGIGVVGLFGVLFIGRFFGRLSTGSALTMLLAPLLCWVTELPRVRQLQPWLLGSLRLALVAIPLVWVLVLAKRDFDRDMAPLLGKIARQECGRQESGWRQIRRRESGRGSEQRRASLDKADLLICDEPGYLAFSRSGAELSYQSLCAHWPGHLRTFRHRRRNRAVLEPPR